MNVHVVGPGPRTGRIVVAANGDDAVISSSRSVGHGPEDVEVPIPRGPHRQVDDGGRVEPSEPIWRASIGGPRRQAEVAVPQRLLRSPASPTKGTHVDVR